MGIKLEMVINAMGGVVGIDLGGAMCTWFGLFCFCFGFGTKVPASEAPAAPVEVVSALFGFGPDIGVEGGLWESFRVGLSLGWMVLLEKGLG